MQNPEEKTANGTWCLPNGIRPHYFVNRSKVEIFDLRPDWKGRRSKYNYKAFSEKGLYMLATVLKSRRAVDKVRGLRRELLDLHAEKDCRRQSEKMRRFGETLADVVMPDLDAVETESTLELNFLIGKLKHTVRRVRKPSP